MDMENTQNNMPVYSSGNSKKTTLITILTGVLVVVALVWWVKQAQVPQQAQVSPTLTATVTPDPEADAINKDVDNINAGDLNAELNAIDMELQGL